MGYYYKEKCVLGMFISLLLLCFSSILFLPAIDDAATLRRQPVRDKANRAQAEFRDRQALLEKVEKANIPAPPLPPAFTQDGMDVAHAEIAYRRDFIKNMTLLAWRSYRNYAWGSNELRPVSKTGHSASIFGKSDSGATIVDAIDTLYIMGLREEYEQARLWIETSLDFKRSEGDLSVFETTIRFVGGLLAAYALTNDKMFVSRAADIADLLLPAFDTPTGIPLAMVNLQSKRAHNWGWASGGCSILSEFGSLHLEFQYLSNLTNNSVYYDKVARIREILVSLQKPDGLYPNYLNPKTGKWGQKHVSVGALGDSFYEYLLKAWVVSNKRDVQAKEMYDEAVTAIKANLLRYSQQNHLAYFAEMKGNRMEDKMDHLACFIAGMFALEAMNEKDASRRDEALHLAEEIGNTCHESYIRTETGIGPESFRFVADAEAVAITEREKYYIQRPEVIEGWFYLWRATGKAKYRDWCWQAALAIEKYCRTPSGYSGIRNVYTKNVALDDVQQSFLLAETLKYLYLVFSDDVMPLDKWVFNTEAHAFPIAA